MAKLNSFGVSLRVEIASVYTTIAQLRDINGPSLQAETIEVTNRDSPSGFKEFIAGLKDGGEVTFDIVYDPDLQTHSATAAGGVVTLLSAGTVNNFRIVFTDPTPTQATFAGLVTKFQPKAPLSGYLAAEVTVKISGALTWA